MTRLQRFLASLGLLVLLQQALGPTAAQAGLFGPAEIEAVTFDASPGKWYLPAAEAAARLRWSLSGDTNGDLMLGDLHLPAAGLRYLADGTPLVQLDDLEQAGALVSREKDGGPATVEYGWRRFRLVPASQRVEVSLTGQRLRAWQGSRLILETKVSTGRRNSTPAGEFKAGPFKAVMHRSSRYKNAPMPWSVQVNGHIFIHGFTSVPDYPASHGCIRVPLTGGNPARFFYEWVHRGTPVSIRRDPPPASAELAQEAP